MNLCITSYLHKSKQMEKGHIGYPDLLTLTKASRIPARQCQYILLGHLNITNDFIHIRYVCESANNPLDQYLTIPFSAALSHRAFRAVILDWTYTSRQIFAIPSQNFEFTNFYHGSIRSLLPYLSSSELRRTRPGFQGSNTPLLVLMHTVLSSRLSYLQRTESYKREQSV